MSDRGARLRSGTRRRGRAFVVLGLLGLLASSASAEEALFDVSEAKAGMRGYGLSVFHGSEPERFEVEVLGVLREVQPETSFILARLSGQGLEQSGVVAGMSGSPVYLDGRLAGAVAFGWPFSKEAIAGITPIAAMRRIPFAIPRATSRIGAGARPELADLARLPTSTDALAQALGALASAFEGEGRSGLMWSAAGFGAGAQALLGRSLAGIAPSGALAGAAAVAAGGPAIAPRTTPGGLVPGGSVAGLLVDGDLRLAATGTVTDRRGDEIFAFGHPVFGVGELALPMAEAEVIGVLPSAYNSFKLANSGAVVGTFRNDHAAGLYGRLGPPPRTLPVTVEVAAGEGGARRFEMRVAEVEQLLPLLVAISAYGALDAAAGSGAKGLDLSARFDLGAAGVLALEQSFDGAGASGLAAVYLLQVAAYLGANDFASVPITRVDLVATPWSDERAALLVSAGASSATVAPGESVEIEIAERPFRGEIRRERLKVVVPAETPVGRYVVLVGDGASADGFRLATATAAPQTLAQALAILSGLHSSRDLVALGALPARGVAMAGGALPRLPVSLQAIWAASPAKGLAALRFEVRELAERRGDAPRFGLLRVDLEVKANRGTQGGAR